MPVVTIPTPLRPHTGGHPRIDAQGATVGEVLRHLGTQYPELQTRLFMGDELQQYVNVYVNSEDIRFLDDLDTKVAAADVVDIIPAVAGG